MRPGFNTPLKLFLFLVRGLYLPQVWKDMTLTGNTIGAAVRKLPAPEGMNDVEIVWACLDLGKQIHFLEIEIKQKGRI